MENKSYDGALYWSQRYVDQRKGWDLGTVSEPLRVYIDQLGDRNQRILVPGAGNGYEAEYLYRAGFTQTYILDISTLPLENFRKRVPDFPADQIIHGDFFLIKGQFDLILEQTFFCSFPPIEGNRERYVQRMHELLKPQGKLVGLWFNIPFSGDLAKRPFGANKNEYLTLFTSCFEVKVFEEAYNSSTGRVGHELFGILAKKLETG